MAADPPFALRLSQVSKVFGGVRALDDIAFEVRVGEVHCLAGENGCGKSTLIKIVTGVHAPEPGARMEVFGETVARMTPDAARRAGIAVIWQDLALFPEMTVAENIAIETLMGRGPRLVSHARLHGTARAALGRLGVELDLEARLRTLPIAERQIVAIARALVQDARLIFMDEPTASLTQSETDSLLAIVRTLAARGVAVVFVSHRLAEVLDICERVTVLRDGRLVGVYPTQGMTPARLTELMTGRTFDSVVAARDMAGACPVLEVRGLSRNGEFEDIDLVVRAGEVVGLTGLIGAGRTELGHALFGMTRPDRGTIRIEGRDVAFRSNRDAIAAGVAYVSEDRLALGLIQPQSIADNTVMSVLRRITGPAGLISGRAKRDLVEGWIRDLSIKLGLPEDPVATLSGGNQQRVVLAKWLATQPRLLILDSPTVGVDVGARAGIFRIVRRLAEQGLAILMISDEVPEVHQNADRVLHMAQGRILGEYDPRRTPLPALEEAVYG
ncbi:sugar ABC transporter ATP-binding protein [Rubellimicrobium arenae]|uniref:sugar ABC transporter ATP-binding protein n=1 Tax=Rubellimicrobium arenae TaxID=2817372 RepID=UPI001B3011D1|nr:sugar ABC transporter ATP-binding protein [Rubellimicrobium arenae]